MKRYLLVLMLGMIFLSASPQNITWATQAKLQVYAMKLDGEQVVMTSDNLIVLYDQLKMAGELDMKTFQTDDGILRSLLDSAMYDKITISAMLPEGKFIYQDALREQFPVETELHYGDLVSQIVITYEVSNRNTSLANTFDITVTGSISLKDDLGVARDTGLEDKISFMFYQNAQTRNY